MRLIDADVLIQYLKTLQAINREDVLYCEDLEDFIDHIEELPTAYDPDKVVEQLKEESSFISKEGLKLISVVEAVSIIKKGGAE